MEEYDFAWMHRVAWDTFDIDQAEPMVKVGMHFIGELVKRRRLRLRLTQTELASAIPVHQSVISRLERGRLRGMRFYKFARLVAVLGGLDPHGPVPHWVIRRRGWPRSRDIKFDDPRWYSPEGVGAALEQGLVELRSLSGIGPTREERVARVLEEEGWEEDDPPDGDPPDCDPPDGGGLAPTHSAASD